MEISNSTIMAQSVRQPQERPLQGQEIGRGAAEQKHLDRFEEEISSCLGVEELRGSGNEMVAGFRV